MEPNPKRSFALRTLAASIEALTVLAIIIPMVLGISLKSLADQLLGKPVYTNRLNPYSYLMKGSGAFARAETELKNGDATSSITSYTEALNEAPDKIQKDQITYKIAVAEEVRGRTLESVRLLKSLAIDERTTKIMRAYSVQELAREWQSHANLTTNVLFSTAPFNTLYHASDSALTQREMYAYAADLYPIAISELYVADWYASALERNARGTGTLSADEKSHSILEVQRRLAAADANIERIKTDPNLSQQVPLAILMRATIERSLVIAGISSVDTATGYFNKALQSYAVLNGPPKDGLARFQYARFMLQTGNGTRTRDIQDMLAPMYATHAYEGSDAFEYFAREKDNVRGKKKYLVNLALVDDHFKQLLIHLGWTKDDFKARPIK